MADLLEGYHGGVDHTKVLAASARVRNYCGWHIAPSITETVTLHGPWVLPSLYVTDVDSIVDVASGLPISVGFDWRRNGILTPHRAVRASRGVTVTFTHGYPTCPEDVQQVVLDMVTASNEVQSESAGPYTQTYFGPTWKNDLAAYRILPGRMITASSRVILPDGRTYEVIGDPEDYTTGPFRFSSTVPAQRSVTVEQASAGVEDSHGNTATSWSAPVSLKVFGWAPISTSEPKVAGRDQVTVDLQLFVPPAIVVNLQRIE